ncbi:MAG: Crp/Fnr family transcriptional regulator [Burkholderiales bacterium]|nr:MAG: Crp/Fnr family transcriptional regulator [Burkholderiales bacterium]
MADSANYALHRPELREALERGEAKIRKLMASDVLELADDTVLIEADRPHDYVYRMRHGWAGRVRTIPDGRSHYILVFLPGDLFAVKSMFVRKHPDAVQLLSRAVVERMHYRDLQAAYATDPDISLRCTWQVVEEERRLHNWVVGLGRGSAEERFAALICQLRGRLQLSGAIARDAQTFQLPMTQEQLADHLGISPVHVNRVLRVFREAGLLEWKSRLLTVLDPAGLGDVASPLLDSYEKSEPAFSGDTDNGTSRASK